MATSRQAPASLGPVAVRINELVAEVERMRKVNSELVEAADSALVILDHMASWQGATSRSQAAIETLRSAISRSSSEQADHPSAVEDLIRDAAGVQRGEEDER